MSPRTAADMSIQGDNTDNSAMSATATEVGETKTYYTIDKLFKKQQIIIKTQHKLLAAKKAEEEAAAGKIEVAKQRRFAKEKADARALARAEAKVEKQLAAAQMSKGARPNIITAASSKSGSEKSSGSSIPSTKTIFPFSSAEFDVDVPHAAPATAFGKTCAPGHTAPTSSFPFSSPSFDFNFASTPSTDCATKVPVIFGAAAAQSEFPVPTGNLEFSAPVAGRKIKALKSRFSLRSTVGTVVLQNPPVVTPLQSQQVMKCPKPHVIPGHGQTAILESLISRATSRLLFMSDLGTPRALLNTMFAINQGRVLAVPRVMSVPQIKAPLMIEEAKPAETEAFDCKALIKVETAKVNSSQTSIDNQMILAFGKKMLHWLVRNDVIPKSICTSRSMRAFLTRAMFAAGCSCFVENELGTVVNASETQGLMRFVGSKMAQAAILNLQRVVKVVSSPSVHRLRQCQLGYTQRRLLECGTGLLDTNPVDVIGQGSDKEEAITSLALETQENAQAGSRDGSPATTPEVASEQDLEVIGGLHTEEKPEETTTTPSRLPDAHPENAVATPQVNAGCSSESWIAASQLQLGTVSYTDFIEALITSGDGKFTRANIASAFFELCNEERECLGFSPHLLPGGTNSLLSCKLSLRKVKIGNTKLSDFLSMLGFTDGVVSDEALGAAFKAASRKEQLLLERIGSRILL